ncbi:DUF411 domain-containing protein [Longimicrobium sp.]|uniref:DUF411 domain-containing protein n=1 Tax=Longimicrobium sp. TaxID=2029185 RepID=UPI003B3ACE72
MKSNVLSRRGRAAVLLLLALGACNGAGKADPAPAAESGAASASPAGQTVASASQPGQAAASAQGTRMVVYKTPTCGCCRSWVDHMQAAGFAVEVHDMPDVAPVKQEHGLPGHLASCHTAIVDGYVVEGHVPADVIRRMLAERPQVAGIAVPGMPAGSPGMEVPGGRKDPYDIIAFSKDGKVSVYETR